MKRKLLLTAMLIAGAMGVTLHAQNALSDATNIDVATFTALSGNYTIEVAGTAGTIIKIPYNGGAYFTYTPSASTTVRFVKSGDVVYAFEKGESAYSLKGRAAIEEVESTTITDDNVTAAENLLSNPEFQTAGDQIASGKYKLGTPWVISDESLYGEFAFRQGSNENAHDASSAPNVFIWRTDGGGYQNKYFYQPVTGLTANCTYKVFFKTAQNTNGPGVFSLRLGSTPGGDEYSKASITIKQDVKMTNSATLTTKELAENSYFSVYNEAETGVQNVNKACCQIDWIALVATPAISGIEGTTSGKYVEEAVLPSIADGDVTAFITNAAVTSTEGWTNGRTQNGEQYTDAPDNTYLDTWNGNLNQKQVVNLPAGHYVLKCATRAIGSLSTGNIYVMKDGTNLNSTDLHKDGNSGGELGNGWGWTEVEFSLAEQSDVTIGFYSECGDGKWAGADNFTLAYTAITEEEECDAILQEAFTLYQETKVPTQNIGSKAFQYNQTKIDQYNGYAAQYGTYSFEEMKNALKAQNKYDKETLQGYLAIMLQYIKDMQILNVPEEGQLFNIINMSEGYDYRGNAVTCKSASDADLTQNTTSFGYNEAPGATIYPQAMKFTAVEDVTNGYLLSYTRADGQEVFIGTGSSTGLGANNNQLRPTTDKEKAVTIQVVATETEGEWNLYNTAANTNIGANGASDQGFYTTNKFNSMTIQEAENARYILTIGLETPYATLIVPFDTETMVDVFTVTTLNGEVLELTAVDAIKANTPYIVYSVPCEDQLQGLSAAYTDATYTNGLLTGVYDETYAPAGSYVLQNQDGEGGEGVGFYQVAEGTLITVPAYKAYLTAPAESAGVKAFFFADKEDDATAIKGLSVLLDGGYEAIYNAAGMKVNSLQKGMNVVKKGGKSYKIYVK